MPEFIASHASDETPEFGGALSMGLAPTELSIRFWNIEDEDVTWSAEHSVIFLAADLIVASGGRLGLGNGRALVAEFACQERALVAAQRLQKAFRAFAESPETAGFGATIVLQKPEDEARLSEVGRVSDLPWSQSSPCQILASSSVYETLQFVPGLQFLADSARSEAAQSGFHEILWAAPETLKDWQDRVTAASNELLLAKQRQQQTVRDAETETVQTEPPVTFPPPFYDGEVQGSVVGSSGKKRLLLLLLAGVASLALLAIIAGVVLTRGKNLNGPLQENVGIIKVATPVTQTPNRSASTTPVSAGQQPKAGEPSKHRPPEHASSTKPVKVSSEPEPDAASYEGFTAKQIPQLLRRAGDDAGAGNYDDAKREYEIVQKLQPGNAAAREGLRKLKLKMGER